MRINGRTFAIHYYTSSSSHLLHFIKICFVQRISISFEIGKIEIVMDPLVAVSDLFNVEVVSHKIFHLLIDTLPLDLNLDQI